MTTQPDAIIAQTSQAELESRIGIACLEELLAERHDLVEQVANLRARYGPFGSANDLRKIELSRIAQIIRAEAVRSGVKLTESAIEEAAHADARYVEHVIVATKERAEWSVLEDRIAAIEDRIQRGNVLGRFAASELALQR